MDIISFGKFREYIHGIEETWDANEERLSKIERAMEFMHIQNVIYSVLNSLTNYEIAILFTDFFYYKCFNPKSPLWGSVLGEIVTERLSGMSIKEYLASVTGEDE